MATEDDVRALALSLGFDAARFTTPAAPDHGDFVLAWLAAGMHGKMGYLWERRKQRNGPLHSQKLLAGAKSVIVVALSYDFSEGERPPGATGVVARYARGEDYHRVIWDKLNALRDALAERYPGTRSRGYADSGPIRERALASRAGIGWHGRHTNLISLDLGNFFFLGALLTTLRLAPDPPFGDGHCGTCTRCMAACPTGAIVAPHTLDARRCISYLTIELTGSIPVELRPLIGDRIFGCDDCLAVCPWNGKARKAHELRLAPRADDAAHPDLLSLLTLLADEDDYQRAFANTPLLRPGRAALRRNVCVALGNVGGADALPALEDAARTDPSEIVREHALWAIERITTG